MRTPRTIPDLIHKELSYDLVGIFYKVHDELGRYSREKHYCDLLERYLQVRKVAYEREKPLSITDIDKNKADFIIENKIILEVKARTLVGREEYYQLLRYLRAARLKLGILINFRQKYLMPKRVLNPEV